MILTTRSSVRRALISVSDRSGLAELGAVLREQRVAVVATGSTAAALRQLGVECQDIGDFTGFPEILDGRVKTLHPRVHAALLADRSKAAHAQELDRLDLEPFDLLVVNLYPFDRERVLDQIDIGGGALLRAAAKNHASVAVLSSPDQYPNAIAALRAGGFTADDRARLAAEAFALTSRYDQTIAEWMSDQSGWPERVVQGWQLVAPLRYGENPHQVAALYANDQDSASLASAPLLHGKPMSYNNYVDASAALRAVSCFAQPAVAIIKHTNPCGIATADSIELAYARAHACDPTSAFGGVIAANRTVNRAMAMQMMETFSEVVLAPDFDAEAMAVLRTKASLRIIAVAAPNPDRLEVRAIPGGALMQTPDTAAEGASHWRLVAGPAASAAELADLEFAMQAVRSVKSNAIVIAHSGATVGIGMGQVNRVDAARLAVMRAGERAKGAIAAGDAFFPFPDGVEVLAQAGVRAIVAPGGSVRDADVVDAAANAGVTLYFTAHRHFLH